MMIVTAVSHMKAVALITSTVIAAGVPAPAVHALPQTQPHARAHRLSTEQMYPRA